MIRLLFRPRMSDDLALLQRTFGLPALRPHQQRSLEALRAGRDVVVILSTGGGKSLCYQFPAVAGFSPTLVVSPLVALMKDQVDALKRRGIAASQVSASMSTQEREDVWSAYEEGALTLLYLAPEALESTRTRDRLASHPPRLLAIDEAHCISEWGDSFRPSYLCLGDVRAKIGAPPTIALTATATARTQREIIERLRLRSPESIVSGFDRPNLSFEVERVVDERTRWQRLTDLADSANGSVVFYATTRRRTEALAAHLRREGIAARGYHAGLPADERGKVQDDFLAGRTPIIVATCAFGMGVDKSDVRLVVHAGPPPTLESYYQEAGRAGRDGAPGRCVALCAPNDISDSRQRLDVAVPTLSELHRVYSLIRDANRRSNSVADSVARIAAALCISPPRIQRALSILRLGHFIAASQDRGAPLRLLATEERIAREAQLLDSGDRAFLERAAHLVATHPPSFAFTRRHLSSLETELTLDARLARLAAKQLLLWSPSNSSLDCSAPWDESSLAQLQLAEGRRIRRDLWRFEGVARFLTTTRCRRLLLLRYFGEELSRPWCGHCDICYSLRATVGR
ncbi:MAG: RecQ family ATP-dependent DNA helicase, partial [Gemmatimonadaceae bacterium]